MWGEGFKLEVLLYLQCQHANGHRVIAHEDIEQLAAGGGKQSSKVFSRLDQSVLFNLKCLKALDANPWDTWQEAIGAQRPIRVALNMTKALTWSAVYEWCHCGLWLLAFGITSSEVGHIQCFYVWGRRSMQSAVKDDLKWGFAAVVLCRSMEGRQLRRDVVSFNAAMKVLGVLPQNYWLSKLKEGKNEWSVFLPPFLKTKDIVRILRHRNRGIDHKIERTSA